MNVALNGNEILFMFLLLHLSKHNSYVRISLLAKNRILPTNAFTKAYFLCSLESWRLHRGTGNVIRLKNGTKKIEIFSKTNQAD